MSTHPSPIFVDTQHLIFLAKSGGLAKGHERTQAEAIGMMALNSHVFSNHELVVTDAVLFEAASHKKFADAQLIGRWADENQIQPVPTTIGKRLLAGEKIADAGEKSIIEAANTPRFAGKPYLIATDDSGDTTLWKDGAIDPVRKIGTVEVLNLFHDGGSGTLPGEQYARIRDGLTAFVPEVPGLQGLDPAPTASQAGQSAITVKPGLATR